METEDEPVGSPAVRRVADSANGALPGDRAASIVGAAIDMFSRYGYQGVGMDDIGAVIGVTGPAIYRHFPSKEALLAAVLDSQGQRVLAEARHLIASAAAPAEALENVVGMWVRHAVSDSARLLVTYFREERHLPVAARAQLSENLATYVAEIAAVLLQVRPELTPAQAKLRVEGALALSNSARFIDSTFNPATLIEELVAMALRLLL